MASRVRIIIDFWNFQLRWKDNMNPSDSTEPRVSLEWSMLPSVLVAELPAVIGAGDYDYRGTHVFASIDPRTGSKDAGLRRYLHWLNQQVGFDITVRDRRPKNGGCPG